jgi:hypothetical protein
MSKPQGSSLVGIIVVAGFTKTSSRPSIKYKCFFCDKSFFSQTKLFKYLKNTKPDYNRKKKSPDLINKLIQEHNLQEIISSAPLLSIRIGLGYCSYMYLIIHLRLTKDGLINTIYWDTGCNTLFINYSWLKRILLGNKICIIVIALTVKSIKSNSHDTSKYVILNLRVLGYNRGSIKPIELSCATSFMLLTSFLLIY